MHDVLDAFMGTPGAHLLSRKVQKHASLRQVIRDDLELKEGDPEGVILGTVIGP